jgi:hypothetical protein
MTTLTLAVITRNYTNSLFVNVNGVSSEIPAQQQADTADVMKKLIPSRETPPLLNRPHDRKQ